MLDIAIIGGGAAGFFAAITAKRRLPEARVTVFERTKKVLAKVEVSGGGRCNLTNSFADVTDLKQVYPRGFRLMKRLFKTFDYVSTYQCTDHTRRPMRISAVARLAQRNRLSYRASATIRRRNTHTTHAHCT